MQCKYIIFLFLFYTISLFCQDTLETQRNNFSIYTGIGKVNYFDNMKVQDYITNEIYIDKSNEGCSLKFMWEPEHRLSIGLETGFYRMYSFRYLTFDTVQFDDSYRYLYVATDYVPIFFNVNMRIINNFSLGIGTGAIVLMNATNAVTDVLSDNYYGDVDIKSSAISLANYHVHANYIFPIGKKKKWQIGAEVRYLWIGKTNDHDITYQILFGYRF